MRIVAHIPKVISLAIVMAFAAACGAGGYVGTALNLTGTWSGSWASSVVPASGTVTANITQSGSSISGSATIIGSPCFTGGNVSGSAYGNTVTFGVLSQGGTMRANFSGVVNTAGSMMSGSYSVNGTGVCVGDSGTFSLTKH
jgi:hypothetical protein